MKPNRGLRCTTLLGIILALAVHPLIADAAPSYQGRWVEGEGDPGTLESIDAAFESMHASPRMACLPMLYCRDWDGFTEGPTWNGWWIQNSLGPSYGMMPFLGEPYSTWLGHSQTTWFDVMGDGRRKDTFGFVVPDGSLMDNIWVTRSGPGNTNGFLIRANYRQGDGKPKMHDWYLGVAAGGLILESERLLIRHDPAAAAARLGQLQRVAAFLDSRRDPKTNLLLAGRASNLLAPSYAGVKHPDGSYGPGYLTEISVNDVAGLDRLAEVCDLCGRGGEGAKYRLTADKVRRALPGLMTPDGCFIMAQDPDGVRHGVFGSARHGYFEATPNHDAVCFSVVDDAAAGRIIDRMLAIAQLAPHGLILPNYPSYDDHSDECRDLMSYGTWVNGGHWTTTQARMSIACLRVDQFAHPLGAWARIRALIEGFRADAPLAECGLMPFPKQLHEPYNVVYDCWGASGGLLRGLFEYDYRSDRLRVRPHLPPGIVRYVQKSPVWFGQTQIYLTVTGAGGGRSEWTELRLDGRPRVLAVEIVRGGAKPRGAWQPASEPPMVLPDDSTWPRVASDDAIDFKKIAAFYRVMLKAGRQESYEAAEARTALELLIAHDQRLRLERQGTLAAPDLGRIPPANPQAVDALYVKTAGQIAAGLVDRLADRSMWPHPVEPEIQTIARQQGLIP